MKCHQPSVRPNVTSTQRWRRRDLEQHQEPARREEAQAVGERSPDVARGVHDVGRDDDVEAPCVQTLVEGIALEVERARPQEWPIAEALRGARREHRGDVREQVVRAIGVGARAAPPRSCRRCRRPPRARAGAGPRREPRSAAATAAATTSPQARAGGRGRVERLGGRRGTAREQELERIDGAGEHLGERAATALGERQLRARLRVPRAQRARAAGPGGVDDSGLTTVHPFAGAGQHARSRRGSRGSARGVAGSVGRIPSRAARSSTPTRSPTTPGPPETRERGADVVGRQRVQARSELVVRGEVVAGPRVSDLRRHRRREGERARQRLGAGSPPAIGAAVHVSS